MRTFYLNPARNKDGLYAVLQALDPTKLWRIRIDEYDERTLEQNEKMHAMLGDIARQLTHLGQHFDTDGWKRLCVKQFEMDCIQNDVPRVADYWRKNSVRLVPSLDGGSVVALGQQTRDFPKYVASAFIEWLHAFGANQGVVWTEREEPAWPR